MALPAAATKVHLDAGADDPKQARAELAALVDTVNALLTHLGGSTITATPLTVGEGLEAASNALRTKLDGTTLQRSAAGLKVNAGTGPSQLVQLDGTSKLPAVDGSQLTGIVADLPGEIRGYGGATAPSGWLLCQGQAVSRVTYANLFAAIGTAFGAGDGSTTFNVPDGRGRTLIGSGQGSGLTNRTLGQSGGEEAHALTAAENGPHIHGDGTLGTNTAGDHAHAGGFSAASSGVNDSGGGSGPANTGNAGDHTHDVTGSTGASGSGTPHNTMPPFFVGNWLIKT